MLSLAQASFRAASGPLGFGGVGYRHIHRVSSWRRVNELPVSLAHAVSPAEDWAAPRPWAPSLTQSPWFLNGSPVCEASVFHPPLWHCFAVSLLPPLAAAAGPAATALAAAVSAPLTTKHLRRRIRHPPRRDLAPWPTCRLDPQD